MKQYRYNFELKDHRVVRVQFGDLKKCGIWNYYFLNMITASNRSYIVAFSAN